MNSNAESLTHTDEPTLVTVTAVWKTKRMPLLYIMDGNRLYTRKGGDYMGTVRRNPHSGQVYIERIYGRNAGDVHIVAGRQC